VDPFPRWLVHEDPSGGEQGRTTTRDHPHHLRDELAVRHLTFRIATINIWLGDVSNGL
jgi:hypothetical protein